MIDLDKEHMLNLLNKLDEKLKKPLKLIVGGGGAMILAHGFPLTTHDIDAVPIGREFYEIDNLVKEVARELGVQGDWLNSYFSSFSHVLPSDYEKRLVEVFKGKNMTALALGKEEMLIMKCFAHRPKDVGHAKTLIKKGADVKFVESHIEKLQKEEVELSDKALDFLDEIREEF